MIRNYFLFRITKKGVQPGDQKVSVSLLMAFFLSGGINFVTLNNVQAEAHCSSDEYSKNGAHTMDALKFWDVFLSKKENFNLMKRIVKSSFPDNPETADEALSYVSEKILVDNKKRLQDYDPSRNATVYFSFMTISCPSALPVMISIQRSKDVLMAISGSFAAPVFADILFFSITK